MPDCSDDATWALPAYSCTGTLYLSLCDLHHSTLADRHANVAVACIPIAMPSSPGAIRSGRPGANLMCVVGLEAYRALLSRALAQARPGSPALTSARVAPDGSLEGVGGARSDEGGAGAAVSAHVAGLLALLVGAPAAGYINGLEPHPCG